MIEAAARPRGPYSFRLSTRTVNDATRVVRDGRLTAVVAVDGGFERASAWQYPDGVVRLQAESEGGLERLRFILALDDDHTPFLRRFQGDPLLGETIRRLRGLRPPRVATVAHSLLRALCGQLIQASRARAIERSVVRATSPALGDLHAPPTAAALARFSPAELRALGLGMRRASTLVRICRTLDLERLRESPTTVVADRLERERGLGPWSAGVVCLEGLGRAECGLTGDLGLVKLCSELRGRWVEPAETAELLRPYGEWAGLASVYLLRGFHLGLIPLPARRLAA